jgi:putative mRNA 3-end processing factor
MAGFDSSKGNQTIYLSKGTFDLLFAEYNADLLWRLNGNIHCVEPGKRTKVNESTIELLPNNHMLGSVQVSVELNNGIRLGYSGDFSWPINDVINVDVLVIDSTAGSPRSRRSFSQGDAEKKLLDLVHNLLSRGPIYIKAYRGTLQRALQVLSGNVNCPIIGSTRLIQEIKVYQKHGYGIGSILDASSVDGKEVMKEQRYLRFYGKGDSLSVDQESASTIDLSAFMTSYDDPIAEYSDRSYRVALSNHADFDGTIQYIKCSGAKFVITDNSRGGNAMELAHEIRNRLNIEAIAAKCTVSREWGV